MRFGQLAPLLVALVLTIAGPAPAQQSGPRSAPSRHFQSWRPAFALEAGQEPAFQGVAATSPKRTRRALIGGAIGAAVGIAFSATLCTAADDPGDNGAAFCSFDHYLLTGGIGFALGAIIGWVT
jgi:hypothetical protein